jgi:SOS-response transcriptional repressor LexA
MPSIAADLLEAGYDTPTIRRLAGEMNVVSSSDVEALVERMFRESAVRYPLSQTEANLIVSRQIAREVIAGVRNPWAAANTLEISIWGWHAPNSILGEIFGINDAIDIEPKYRPSLEELRNQLLDSFASLARLTNEEILLASTP